MEIDTLTNVVVTVEDGYKIFFGKLEDAEIFLGLHRLVADAYKIHAGDIKQSESLALRDCVFKKDYGKDSTDYVTVMPINLTKKVVDWANENMLKLQVALPMIDDLAITRNQIFFECHCPSER